MTLEDAVCTCSEFQHLEFDRRQVSKRIRDTAALKKQLEIVAVHPGKRHKLYRCSTCDQFWQCSRAWNWGNKDYLFRVPSIHKEQWCQEAFVSPSDLMEYGWSMGQFLLEANFVVGSKKCSISGCSSQAVIPLSNCLLHHVRELQRMGQLGPDPTGRWFDPYVAERCLPAL